MKYVKSLSYINLDQLSSTSYKTFKKKIIDFLCFEGKCLDVKGTCESESQTETDIIETKIT